MRVTRTLLGLALSATLLPSSLAAQPAPDGSVTPVSQERVVSASGNQQADSVTSIETGPFAETRTGQGFWTVCVPSGTCITARATATATQRSLITATEDGVLEIRGLLAGTFEGLPGLAGAATRLTSTFVVDGVVPYVLQADRFIQPGTAGLATLVLEDAQGQRIEDIGEAAGIFHVGRLPAGTYTLRAEVSRASLDVRFTVGEAGRQRPRCIIQTSAPQYRLGHVVTASRLLIVNQHADAIPVELKIWLRLPDGREVPARNDGANGTVSIPAGVAKDYAPLAIMGVDSTTAPGLYEFGCRLLNPITGQQLDEDSDLFEIQ